MSQRLPVDSTVSHDFARALIAFGSNQGDSEEFLQSVLKKIEACDQIDSVRCSPPMYTKAVGGEDQPDFLNAVISVSTRFSADQLHQRLVEIENESGRLRRTRWGARTVDLDLLLFDQQVINSSDLTLPHPRMSFRRFVLEPALAVAEEMIHPLSGLSIKQLVQHLDQAEQDFQIVLPPSTKDQEHARQSWSETLHSGLHDVQPDQVFTIFESGKSVSQRSKARFLVFDLDQFDPCISDSIVRLAAPTLNLTKCSTAERRREINAAIQAARPMA